ncbi:MAG: KH domain-containing protein [Candidatus Heimdallarchaeota archaeon]
MDFHDEEEFTDQEALDDEEFTEEDISRFLVTIPHNRIGALIGPKGRVKSRLEKLTGVDIEIDSSSGEVLISSTANLKDPFLIFKARDFVQAVGRGFNPEAAFTLLDDDIYLEIINLKYLLGNNPNKLRRFRGRIIGREGKTRQIIEETTGTKISVFGNTVGIIGTHDRLRVAKEAIEMLIGGSKHGTVYSYLEEKAQTFKLSSRELWEKASKDARKPF